ncbi:transcription initiation factor TFIID subunit 4B-like [Hippocampus zosterae]|uniref:transcription initiation factor TFIID subunit 4B-like n=1 Tax=Hippocampus zosterae TaxID=109293 RepID=UPI00223E523F|nr:transcription initiation factor TFIID subunit 4B-like [Hippocampus zosterae]XP_051928893.1 transcription initiation factor TFIID subunit 4B-like [Hippocampus zosterae]
MATNKDPMGAVQDGEPTIQVKNVQVAAKCGHVPSPGVSKGQVYQATSTSSVPAPQMSSPSVMVVTKVSKPSGASANGPKAVLSQANTTMNPTSVQGRTVVITVPRSTGPQVPMTPRTQLPANIQIPPGMMLIRSDSGQLMLMSQQALAQAQQALRTGNGQATGILARQVSTAGATSQSNEKVTVIRMTAPQTFQPPAVQKTAMVKVIGVTPKPAVVQTRSEAAEHAFQPVTVETKKDPPPTFSQASVGS